MPGLLWVMLMLGTLMLATQLSLAGPRWPPPHR
jgi:hypothetical protein